jgi:hypothetical protein
VCEDPDVPPGPRFIWFLWPTPPALRDLGGSAKSGEVIDLVLDTTFVSDDERAEQLKSGGRRVDNRPPRRPLHRAEVGWA